MASNKSNMRGPEASSGASLAGTLLRMLAVGVAGGIALIGGAKKLGEQIEKKQKEEYIKLEKEREAQVEAAKAAAAADAENIEETAKEIFAEADDAPAGNIEDDGKAKEE